MRLFFLPLPASVAAGLAMAMCVTACTSAAPKPAYQAESFATESPFEHRLDREPLAACQLGQRALLSQGYQVDNRSGTTIRGTKYFQPEADHQMRLDITLVCLPVDTGTVVYSNAVQTRYELKSRPTNTGVSLAGVGSISLPWSSDKEALIKVGEETVADPGFYRRFFELLQQLAE